MTYTQKQKDEAFYQKRCLKTIKSDLEDLIDLATKCDMHDLSIMLKDLQDDVQTRIGEVDDILHADYMERLQEDVRSYFAAVM